MFSKTAATVALLATAASVSAAPVTSNPSSILTRQATIAANTDQCFWDSNYDGANISWAIILTRWLDNTETQESNDLRASLDSNYACRAFNSYDKQAFGDDEVAFVFNTPISCTAYQMTKVIEKTNGGAHGSVACTNWEASDDGPDISDVMQEVPVDGEPSPDVDFERRAAPAKLLKPANATLPAVNWAELAGKLGMASNTAPDVIVKALSGPSKFDETW